MPIAGLPPEVAAERAARYQAASARSSSGSGGGSAHM
eukprot:COSAG01_NODE_59899_length_297_cov_1.308081_1_plen_36_part_01